jgi:ATP phosphoribosyltransferase
MLTIALPKGRIASETLAIFKKIFGDEFVFEDRKLILEQRGFRFLLVRNQDVPTYVFHGSADIGVVGFDVLEEKSLQLVELADLGIGKCKVVVGMRDGQKIDYSKHRISVATKMENITRNYFAKKAMAVDVIKLYGSIELAPLVGLADAIVDIVETGATMKQNGLVEVETIMTSSARLIANKNSFVARKKEILELTARIEQQLS